jgi:dihydroxyacetone kinase
LRSAVGKAAEAAEATRDLEARVGRSAYVEASLLKRERVPDPGAWGIKVLLEALAAADGA